jgi:sugar lactone lactonase YvrE
MSLRHRLTSRALPILIFMGLAGCGGGGSSGAPQVDPAGADSGAAAPPPTAPVVVALAGSGNADGIGAAARFNRPIGVATDSAGNVYVADTSNHTIRKITPAGGVSTFAGVAGVSGSADGSGATASFAYPQGVATDRAGNLYVVDQGNNTIRRISPLGAVSTFAGSPGSGGSTDGTGNLARFNFPIGIATDAAGNVFVADSGNFTVRRITPAGAVTTLAGTAPGLRGGGGGSADGIGAAAHFARPTGVATDSSGNVYVADQGASTIRKITAAGVVTTLAGVAGMRGSGDGSAAAARFHDPIGVATDSVGNLYVGDTFNNTVRKISPAGAVSTLAGTAGQIGNTDATGAAARFNAPIGVATDAAGQVYVTDTANNSVRRITPAGVVSTLAGS